MLLENSPRLADDCAQRSIRGAGFDDNGPVDIQKSTRIDRKCAECIDNATSTDAAIVFQYAALLDDNGAKYMEVTAYPFGKRAKIIHHCPNVYRDGVVVGQLSARFQGDLTLVLNLKVSGSLAFDCSFDLQGPREGKPSAVVNRQRGSASTKASPRTTRSPPASISTVPSTSWSPTPLKVIVILLPVLTVIRPSSVSVPLPSTVRLPFIDIVPNSSTVSVPSSLRVLD